MIPLPKSLSKIPGTPTGKEMSKWLAEHILALDTLAGIDFSDKEKSAIQGEGRKLAAKTLKDILSTLLTSEDKDTIRDGRDDLSMNID